MDMSNRLILFLLFCPLSLISCEKAHEQPPREEVVDLPDLASLFKTGQFDELARIIDEHQKIYEADPAREMHVVAPYRLFIEAASSREDRPIFDAKFEEWEAYTPDSFVPYMVMCSYSYGIAKHSRGDTRKSAIADMRTHCDYALKLNPKLPYAYGRLIKAGNMDGNQAEVERWLRQGLTAVPESYFLRSPYQPLLSPRSRGSNEEMLAFANRAQRYVDKNPMLVRLLGDAYDDIGNQHFQNKEYQKAIAAYKKSYSYFAWPNPLISLAAAYSRIGEHDLAIETRTKVMEIHDSIYTYLNRSMTYSAAGRFDEAMADIDYALEKAPGNPQFISQKAYIYYKTEDYARALEVYERLAANGAADANDWGRIAWIKQRKIVDLPAAEASYTRSIMLDSRNTWVWHEFATLLYNNKDQRAPAAFQAYVDLCAAKKGCDPVIEARSRKFVNCVSGKGVCELNAEEYSHWVPGA